MIPKSEAHCGKVYHKYLYLVGITAVLVMVGSYWYIEYYGKQNPSMDQVALAQSGGVRNHRAPNPTSNTPGLSPFSTQQPQAMTFSPQAQQIAAPAIDPLEPVAASTFAAVVRSIMPSVVNVSATNAKNPVQTNADAPGAPQAGLKFAHPFSGIAQESIGSGIIVTKDGYVLTNFHVIEQARHISVTVFNSLGTKRYFADVIGQDETRDLALLKITPERSLYPAALGNSDRVQVGDSVIAIGSPFGLDQTVSKGILSGRNKVVNIGGNIHKGLMQTDAAINRGNSGGPLVDQTGSVIGINTAIYTTTSAFSGVGFAVPMNMARDFLDDFIQVPNVKPDLKRGAVRGVAVAAPNGAPPIMANAIMPHGDRGPCESCHEILPSTQPVAAVNNGAPPIMANAIMPHGDRGPCESCHEILPSTQPIRFGLGPNGDGRHGPGHLNQFAFSPGGAIGLPAAMATNIASSLGFSLSPLDQANAQRLNSPVPGGILVVDVGIGSAAERSGFLSDDIIFKLDGRRLSQLDLFEASLANFDPGEMVRISIVREGQRMDLNLPIERPGVQTVALQQPQQMTFAGAGAETGNLSPPAQQQMVVNPANEPPPVPAKQGGMAPARTEFEWMGMEMTPISPGQGAKTAANPQGKATNTPLKRGALVADVDVGSAAQRAGIKRNDVLVAINGHVVDTAGALDKQIKAATGQAGVLLEIDRSGQRMFTVLQ
ncbi:MAG: trypsin-like peptidase domain-containing protein [Magnetococcales bacterium]|nr:trypsin-like peptidase domain-containing protein [Magnetococcales bacterium]